MLAGVAAALAAALAACGALLGYDDLTVRVDDTSVDAKAVEVATEKGAKVESFKKVPGDHAATEANGIVGGRSQSEVPRDAVKNSKTVWLFCQSK